MAVVGVKPGTNNKIVPEPYSTATIVNDQGVYVPDSNGNLTKAHHIFALGSSTNDLAFQNSLVYTDTSNFKITPGSTTYTSNLVHSQAVSGLRRGYAFGAAGGGFGSFSDDIRSTTGGRPGFRHFSSVIQRGSRAGLDYFFEELEYNSSGSVVYRRIRMQVIHETTTTGAGSLGGRTFNGIYFNGFHYGTTSYAPGSGLTLIKAFDAASHADSTQQSTWVVNDNTDRFHTTSAQQFFIM